MSKKLSLIMCVYNNERRKLPRHSGFVFRFLFRSSFQYVLAFIVNNVLLCFVHIEPGSKSGAGLDDSSISGDDSALLSAKACSSRPEGRDTAKSEF